MVRIWAKTIKDNRIVKQTVLEDYTIFYPKNFFDYVASICSELDVATPVILSKHINHYMNFNNTTFLPDDFPEKIDFDKLVLEEASKY